MSGGVGFSRWADRTNKSNRQLLKGSADSTYKHFDKSYITKYIISRKPLLFKEATPEYLEELRVKLKYLRKKEIERKVMAMIISIVIISPVIYWLLTS